MSSHSDERATEMRDLFFQSAQELDLGLAACASAGEWDARAQSLGGTSNTLLAGLAARLAQGMGRVGTDGSVRVAMPVNERTADDTRANAGSWPCFFS